MSETRISEKPGVLCPCQTDLGGRARVLEGPRSPSRVGQRGHGAPGPGEVSGGTGAPARAAQWDAAECSEPVCGSGPGGPRPASPLWCLVCVLTVALPFFSCCV